MTSQSRFGKILVTGASSGLGKHCYEDFHAFRFIRDDFSNFNGIINEAKKKTFDAIVHSAFNVFSPTDDRMLYAYLTDNLLLIRKLLSIPHGKFVFISSIEVYPKTIKVHCEDEKIDISELETVYGIMKLMAESIVKAESSNWLILRPTALLGKHSRQNSLMRLLVKEHPDLPSGKSEFNYILHSDVLDFIKIALEQNLTGVFNLASVENIRLADVASYFKKNVEFGEYRYMTGKICPCKALIYCNNFKNSSLKNIKTFLGD